MKRKILTSLPILIASFGIYYLSDQPKPIFLDVEFAFKDKLMHLAGYFGYGIASQIFIIGWWEKKSSKFHKLLAFTIGLIFALSDEFHQSFVPGRFSEGADLLADMAGTALSLLLYRYLYNLINTRKNER